LQFPETSNLKTIMPFNPGAFVTYLFKASNIVGFAKVEAVTKSDNGDVTYILEIAKGVFQMIPGDENLTLLPDEMVKKATAVVNAGMDARKIQALAVQTPLLVTSAAASGLYGGAAFTNGLVSIGGSMVGGIVVVSMAPALLSAAALRKLVGALQNDGVTTNITTIAGVMGGITGTGVAIGIIAEGGLVVGLSGPGIMSGVAALGGGTLASGGGGVAAGLVVASSIACVGVFAFGGIAYLISSSYRQAGIKEEYMKRMTKWQNQGKRMPPRWEIP
jgi:hypothetical protein